MPVGFYFAQNQFGGRLERIAAHTVSSQYGVRFRVVRNVVWAHGRNKHRVGVFLYQAVNGIFLVDVGFVRPL